MKRFNAKEAWKHAREQMPKGEEKRLIWGGIIFGIVLAVVRKFNLISTEAIQLIITFVLVSITAIYVKRTSDISKATKQQAKASVEMAEATREQGYTECLPLLVPNITRRSIVDRKLEPNEIEYRILQTGMEVTWQNLGKGVAINSRFSFWSAVLDSHPGKSLYFSPRESNALGVAAKESISFEPTSVGWGHQLVDQTKPRLEAEYQDIYERKIVTVQEFCIEEQNNTKRAFLGDLYFTVNGKRLGEEATQHDKRSYRIVSRWSLPRL